jgi:hypothetical protein
VNGAADRLVESRALAARDGDCDPDEKQQRQRDSEEAEDAGSIAR